MATSFNDDNDWAIPDSDVKMQIYIDKNGTYYRSYVNLDAMTLVSNFYHDNKLLGRAEWNFSNSTWFSSEGQEKVMPAQLSNTTYDPVTGASMTVFSND